MTTVNDAMKRPEPHTAEMAASIAELWQQWLTLTDSYHAAPNPNGRAAGRAYATAKMLALCLACIPATGMADIRPKVIMAAWLRQYDEDTHTELMIEAAIAADHELLQPPIDRELH